MTLTKWFYSTRLETRTKESNSMCECAGGKPVRGMKVTVWIFLFCTNDRLRSSERGLSMSDKGRTRKMVNYV